MLWPSRHDRIETALGWRDGVCVVTKRQFLIDTDAAADDLLALLLALNADDISVETITVVSGACRADQGTQNVQDLLKRSGHTIPVFAGRHAPLFGPLRDSTHIMGSDGLGGHGPAANTFPIDAKPACDAIRQFIKTYPRTGTIVCLGPLTNLALALLTEPALACEIGRLVIIGGVSDGIGNITPSAEFNIWADPEAAKVVFEAGILFDLVGWDISRREDCTFSPGDLEEISDAETPLATYSINVLSGLRAFLRENLGTENVDLPDPIAMAIALDETLATGWLHRHVEIDSTSGPSRGSTIVDHLQARGSDPNARILAGADKPSILEMLCRAVRAGQGS